MFRPRVIPCLLLKNLGLVKSVKFKDYKYIGDPMNAVKIFNDKKADELVFLDILATKEKRKIDLELLRQIGDEANMPFGVGGGINSIENIRELINAGAEKAIINSAFYERPDFIKEAADQFGSSTIVVSIDVRKKLFGGYQVYVNNGTKNTGSDPVEWAQKAEQAGAGEIIINSIDNDGVMQGYDTALINKVATSVSIPVIALGGAGSYKDFSSAVNEGGASAVAAGSLFVFHGPRKAVLISFPTKADLKDMFKN